MDGYLIKPEIIEKKQDPITGLWTEKYPNGDRFEYVVKTDDGKELCRTRLLNEVAAFVAGYKAGNTAKVADIGTPIPFDHPCVELYVEEGMNNCDDFSGCSCSYLQNGGTWETCPSGGKSWANKKALSPDMPLFAAADMDGPMKYEGLAEKIYQRYWKNFDVVFGTNHVDQHRGYGLSFARVGVDLEAK